MKTTNICKLLYSIFGDNAADTILSLLDDFGLDEFLNYILDETK